MWPLYPTELNARHFPLCYVSSGLKTENSSEGKHGIAEAIQKLVNSFSGEQIELYGKIGKP